MLNFSEEHLAFVTMLGSFIALFGSLLTVFLSYSQGDYS
ncbi:MAG: hypothetical protein UX35_C0011G0016 [Microgenomates group bacterium GW2011_GWA1_46_15]|nr:MAG: hypothetical protein UX00_C0006G0022 [Microgenomates group bacterium GW2011_GWB1_45_17]KKU23072.1 MAG: hypothetical protein UX35_C0011G0016 [Microgenomates group bacterium GW2011_GWA1_46_15]KKU23725.1 MAG: hypothetical protein UX36_C0003G0025 [Microgenomates group bacterium GW2011_GWC1_46_15]